MQLIFQTNKPLGEVCTLGIGGQADLYLEVRTVEMMQLAIRHCRQQSTSYFILGKGSNCLFDDEGFQGAVLHNKIAFFENLNDGQFHVGAGYSFSYLGTQTARLGFGGLEFASGIPASVGGAIFMNAGANGGQTFDYLLSVDYIDETGQLHLLPKNEINHSYRFTSFQEKKGVIVGATFSLPPSAEARKKQISLLQYRQKTQPYKDKSAGCVFQNPPGHHAGLLIDQCGLKGSSYGGAKVSEIHANFLINANRASSKDFLSLIQQIQMTIEDKTGIKLKSEVRYVPSGRISR
ncbi:MAG: UDP-N-acetylmuramate dehydrogenase [Parachlamydiaceae bacterium]